MAQALDAGTLQQSHGAGKIIRPDRLRSIALGCLLEIIDYFIEGFVPGDRRELPLPLGTGALKRDAQSVWMGSGLAIQILCFWVGSD